MNTRAAASRLTRPRTVPEIVDAVGEEVQLQYTIGALRITPGMHVTPTESAAPAALVLAASPGSGAGGQGGAAARFAVVVDPDPPLGLGQIVHGAALDVPLGVDVFGGAGVRSVAAHRGAGPPANTGKHRYIALAFRQGPGFDAAAAAAAVPAMGFDVRKWAAATGLGAPVGGTVWISAYDGSARLTAVSALLCACCVCPPPEDWAERAAGKAKAP